MKRSSEASAQVHTEGPEENQCSTFSSKCEILTLGLGMRSLHAGQKVMRGKEATLYTHKPRRTYASKIHNAVKFGVLCVALKEKQ